LKTQETDTLYHIYYDEKPYKLQFVLESNINVINFLKDIKTIQTNLIDNNNCIIETYILIYYTFNI